MSKGGAIIDEREARVIRKLGFMGPIALLGYGYLSLSGVLPGRAADIVGYLAMASFVVIALFHIIFNHRNKLQASILLLMYCFGTTLFTVGIVGFVSPLSIFWPLLILAGHLYFRSTGVQITVLALTASLLIDTFLYYDSSMLYMLQNAATYAIVCATATILVKLSQANRLNWIELRKTRSAELIQRDRILALINNLADGVIATDRDGIVQVYNAGSLNLLDTNEKLDGKHINEVLSCLKDEDNNSLKLSPLFRGTPKPVVRDDLSISFGAQTLLIELSFLPIRTAYSEDRPVTYNHDGFIFILKDITRIKSLEEEKDEFISVVSHELRTPITITEGTISNLQLIAQKGDIKQDILEKEIHSAHEQVVFLSKMINDLSTLSRAERGVADTPELVDVKELAEDLYHEYSPRAEHAKLTLDLDMAASPGYIHVSPLYIKEILQNFLTNAFKYTKKGGVKLIISGQKDNVTFAVKDSGIGISKPDQKHIYEKFFRSEDFRTRETRGTGLGLYVAAKLARKMNTRIELESRLNYGSTFSITLPKAKK